MTSSTVPPSEINHEALNDLRTMDIAFPNKHGTMIWWHAKKSKPVVNIDLSRLITAGYNVVYNPRSQAASFIKGSSLAYCYDPILYQVEHVPATALNSFQFAEIKDSGISGR
jgi:hypothetical protein